MMLPSTRLPLYGLVALGLVLRGQSAADAFSRPPAGVEENLRERVTAFYALHKEGKFRQAEAYICADSKDAYYDQDKRQWSSLEIIRISYENEFKSAKLVLALGTELRTRSATIPAKYPLSAMWKVEDGQWCNYIPPASKAETITPFGLMRQTEAGTGKPLPRPNSEALFQTAKVSKRQLTLKAREPSSDELEIHNGLPGIIYVDVDNVNVPGFKWSLAKKTLDSGDRVALKVTYDPAPNQAPPTDLVLRLRIEPLAQVAPIRVLFDSSLDPSPHFSRGPR